MSLVERPRTTSSSTAETAGTGRWTDGAAVRDRLRAVGSPPGRVANASPRGVADALRVLGRCGEIEYEGASDGMGWDENGDLRPGQIGIWRFTGDERIEEVEAVPFIDLAEYLGVKARCLTTRACPDRYRLAVVPAASPAITCAISSPMRSAAASMSRSARCA